MMPQWNPDPDTFHFLVRLPSDARACFRLLLDATAVPNMKEAESEKGEAAILM